MAGKTVRAIKRDGHLELLDPVDLPDGEEVKVTLEVVTPVLPAADKPHLATWDLGVKGAIKREDIYDDLL